MYIIKKQNACKRPNIFSSHSWVERLFYCINVVIFLSITPDIENCLCTFIYSVQVSSVAQSCLTLCNPMDCSILGLRVHHQLPEFTETHVYWVGDAIKSLILWVPFSSHLQSFPSSGSFQMSQLFASRGLSIRVSVSTSVLPMNTQDWSPLG